MAWIESHQSLSRHHKTLRAIAILKIDKHRFIGHLHELWWWALDNVSSDGSLRDMSDREIAKAAEWNRKPEVFVSALMECGGNGRAGFIEVKEGQRYLHDWYDYAGRLQDRRQSDRERKRRETHQNSDGIPQELSRTQPNTTNRTQPNTTQPKERKQTKKEKASGEQPSSSSKDITIEYIDEMGREFPDLDTIRELKKCRMWWQERKKRDPTKRAYYNWLEKAQRIKNEAEGKNATNDIDQRVDWFTGDEEPEDI